MKKNWLVFLLLATYANSFSQTADFSFSTDSSSHCEPYTTTFTQTCSGNPRGFIWNFGNNQRGSDPVETVNYTAGTYSITLTALYANTAISITKTLTVNPTPIIILRGSKNYLCKPGTIVFTATGNPSSTNYEWNFGDGSAVENTAGNTIAHPYADYGSFTASVKVATSFGCSASSNYVIRVSKFGITGTMSLDHGCVPAITDFNVSSDLPPGDAPSNYSWTFGDNSSINSGEANSISHRYTSTDSITTANVVISSTQGCSNQFNFPAFAFGTPPSNTIVKTALPKDTFCSSEIIKFYCSASKANAYLWQFSDSTRSISTDTFMTHRYRILGTESNIVTPFFNGCAGNKDSVIIFIKGVIASFNYNNLCNNKTAFQFHNYSLGNVTHFEWEFSDMPMLKDSIHFSVPHIFPVTGSFVAALSLADSTTGCIDHLIFNIYTAVPSLSRSTNNLCKDSLVTYSVSNTYPANAGYKYEFFVNGNMINNGGDSILNYHPSIHGSFAEYVVIKDAVAGTCSDTLQLSGNTIVKGPVVDFTSPPILCVDKAFSFTNNSYPFYAADAIATWRWNYGDNKQDSVKNPLPHLYRAAANYYVTLTATDINGCAQSVKKIITAAPLPKIIAFPAEVTICGLRDTAMLTGYTIDSLLWLPSTSISCTSCDTTRAYPAVTTSYIAQATNRFGCQNYDTCLVKVFSPFHIKVFPSDTALCTGLTVPLTLNTTGIISWTPVTYLSNGSIRNPLASPLADISYTVTVKDSAGCYSDSAVSKIHLYPLPAVKAGDDKVLPYNTAFTINPIYSPGVTSYLWEPTATLSCSNCPSVSGIATKSTKYTVKTTSKNGCKSSDDIIIYVACEKSNLLLPTAFTPNGNGLNDNFYPITRGYRTIKTFLIFNRRGNKVFERQNFSPNIPSLGWDGIIKNAETVSSSEVFAWYLEAECEQGQTIVSKGTVVLVR